jgi:prephenate dehydratase
MRKDRVAVLGPEGTFTEIAARRIFGCVDFVYCDNVDEVFDSVNSGVEFGVVAIENSLEGSVSTTMDCLMDYDLSISGEVVLDINLCLAVPPGMEKGEIRTVISHPHALAQCREFLSRNFPKARLQRHESTAAAMEELKNLENSAAIGPKETAGTYGLEVLFENIQDAKSQTRFIVISKKKGQGKKTSMIFALKDEPGALYKALKEFADREINLTKIESRPSKRKLGEYLFFVDFEGSLKDLKVKEAISSIKEKTAFLTILGSY